MEEDLLKKVRSYQDNLQLPTNSLLLNYLTDKRCLSIETIKQFQLGIDEKSNIAIPVHSVEGNLIGFKYRANPFNNISSKYWHSEGLANSIFNIHRIKAGEQVVITEGEIDCMTLFQAGIQAVSQTTGAGLQIETVQRLFTTTNPKQIIVALDSDPTGVKSMYRLAKLVKATNLPVRFIELNDVKDWNELAVLSKEQGWDIREEIERRVNSSLSASEFLGKHYKDFEEDFIRTISVSEIKDQKMEFLANPLFVKNGVNLITASPKSLKSMLVLELLIACMKGEKFVGYFPTSKISKALLIDQESIKAEVKGRIIKFAGNTDGFLMTADQIFFDKDKDLSQKLLDLIEFEGIDVVVIDTLRRVNQDMDENSSKDVSRFFGAVIPLAVKATVIVVHHETKGNAAGFKSSYRGSGDIVGAVDSHVYIQKVGKATDNGAVIRISHPNSRYTGNFDDVEVEFVSDGESFKFNFLDKAEDNRVKQLELQLEENLLSLEEYILSGNVKGRNTEEIEQYCKTNFDGMGQHKARQLREILITDELIMKVMQFEGSKATHFIHKEFATQQLNTL